MADPLRDAVNASCSCGGLGPDDPGACPACMVWHRMRGVTAKASAPGTDALVEQLEGLRLMCVVCGKRDEPGEHIDGRACSPVIARHNARVSSAIASVRTLVEAARREERERCIDAVRWAPNHNAALAALRALPDEARKS